MRVFRYGEAFAIVIPESVRAKLGLKEGDDYDVVFIEPGLAAMAKKENIAAALKDKVAGAANKAPEFIVVNNEVEAKQLSQRFEKQLKSGEMLGVRGGDKKSYVVSVEYYNSWRPRITRLLEAKICSMAEIAADLKLSPDTCFALLALMKEEGELIEKKKGLFSLVR